MEDIDERDMEQEDTRAEDEYAQEGLFYKDLDNIITGYEKNGVFRDHKASVASVLKMLLEKVEKEPTPTPEKHPGVIIKMSLRSWDNFDNDLKVAEHHLVGAITRVRTIRNNILGAKVQKLKEQAKDNLARLTGLEESVSELEELVGEIKDIDKGTKDKDAKEAAGKHDSGSK